MKIRVINNMLAIQVGAKKVAETGHIVMYVDVMGIPKLSVSESLVNLLTMSPRSL